MNSETEDIIQRRGMEKIIMGDQFQAGFIFTD
jgi:hypothetical protein